VVSNLLVRDVCKLVKFALENDFASAGKLHRRLYPVFKALFVESNPIPIKAALARAGIIGSDEVRLPLCEMSAPNRAILECALEGLGK
jgi:4-hydroxy-tetrahydrodipicolinate synthase